VVEIIPSINSSTWEDAEKKIRLVEPYVKWVHLDIADGTFTQNYTTWRDFNNLVGFKTNLKLEVHLMIDRPDEQVGKWLLAGVDRIITHIEVTKDPEYVWEKCHEVDAKFGLSIATQTPWMALKPYVKMVDMLEILAVKPGRSGQEFGRHNYYKIHHLRRFCDNCVIGVDGGVNFDNAKKIIKEGADIIVAGAAIFSSNDIGQAIDDLKTKVDSG